jgi:uncharacterized membrane protein
MLTLSLRVYGAPDAADTVASVLKSTDRKRPAITDYAVVSWPLTRARPSTCPSLAGADGGVDLGPLWGALFGVSFYIPLRATPANAVQIDLSNSLDAIGLDADMMQAIQRWVRPGTSALFIVSPEPLDAAFSALRVVMPKFLLERTLPADLEERLAAMFMV